MTDKRPISFRTGAATVCAMVGFVSPASAASYPWPVVQPLFGGFDSGPTYQRAMRCLTQAIYYEAGSEPRAGKEAVAQVVLNRVKHPSFPKSVCGVVFDGAERATGCQFTFTCDGSLSREPLASKWEEARSVAADALAGKTDDHVGASTHYHASWMVPYWRSSMIETVRIGGHIFYQWPGTRGSATSLTSAYSGVEPEQAWPPRWQSPRAQAARAMSAPPTPPVRSGPSTFSVWGLAIATVTPTRNELRVRPAG